MSQRDAINNMEPSPLLLQPSPEQMVDNKSLESQQNDKTENCSNSCSKNEAEQILEKNETPIGNVTGKKEEVQYEPRLKYQVHPARGPMGSAVLKRKPSASEVFLTAMNRLDGRDKMFRVFQYASATVVSLLPYMHLPVYLREQTSETLSKFKGAMSMTRKTFRFFKIATNIQVLLKLVKETKDKANYLRAIEAFAALAAFFDSLYFIIDHLIWFSRIGMVSLREKVAKYLPYLSVVFWGTAAFMEVIKSTLMLALKSRKIALRYSASEQSFPVVVLEKIPASEEPTSILAMSGARLRTSANMAVNPGLMKARTHVTKRRERSTSQAIEIANLFLNHSYLRQWIDVVTASAELLGVIYPSKDFAIIEGVTGTYCSVIGLASVLEAVQNSLTQ